MEQLTSADGSRIALDRTGAGPSLIIVSGATVPRRLNEGLVEAFTPHFTVLNYDRRGRGDSTDALDSTGDTTSAMAQAVQRETEDLGAVVEACGDSAPVILGFSSGAAVAANAVAAGVPASRLILWEVPFNTADDASRTSAAYTAKLVQILDADDRDGALRHFYISAAGVPEPVVDGMSQSPFWAMALPLAHTVAYDAASLGDTTVPSATLGRISVPTLVMAGDNPYFQSAAQAVAAALPHGTYQHLAGQDHNVDPAVLTTALLAFLSAPQ